jgi:acyl-CoA synthetase (AMP-forming)/AMP-acid ligase II
MTPTLTQRWTSLVRRKGDALAARSFPDEASWSFRELDAHSDQIAESLRGKLPECSVVAIRTQHRLHWLSAFLAIHKAGMVALPIESSLTEHETQVILDQLKANASMREEHLHLHSTARHPALKKAGIRLYKLTSGSTSAPKAIAFTEAQMMADADQILSTMEIGDDESQFVSIPLAHSYALGSLVYPLLQAGTPLYFNSLPLPSILLRELAESRARIFPTIPAILQALERSEAPALPPDLRKVISAASPLSPELARRFEARFKLRIHNFYGSSETGGIAYDRSGDNLLNHQGVGEALNGVRLHIRPGGRIEVSSAAVHTHRNRIKRSPEGHGTFLLPDKGRIEANSLVLEGRSNRQVKHNGKRINLEQIEKILESHPEVQQAHVSYHEGRHRLVAAISGKLSPEALATFAQQRLSPWKRPKWIWITDTLPTTARGKLDRKSIEQKLLEQAIPLRYSDS